MSEAQKERGADEGTATIRAYVQNRLLKGLQCSSNKNSIQRFLLQHRSGWILEDCREVGLSSSRAPPQLGEEQGEKSRCKSSNPMYSSLSATHLPGTQAADMC